MWSVACNSQLLSPAMMPSDARPIALNDALETLPRLTDDHAPVRALGAAIMLLQAAQPPGKHAVFAGLAGQQSSQVRVGLVTIVNQLILLGLVINFEIFFDLWNFASEAVGCVDWEAKCEKPVATGLYSSIDRTTTLRSELVAKKRIEEVAPLLDPRGWADCGEVFKESYLVREQDGRFVRFDSGVKLGESWPRPELLHESVAIGPHRATHVLDVDYRVDLGRGQLHLEFSLYESIKSGLAGLRLPGLMRMNSGTVDATMYQGKGGVPDPSRTKIVAEKRLHYGRASRWSGAGVFDYGEILNYLAPAFLTLWTDDLRRVVPCC